MDSSQSQSYLTVDGQSASLSLYQANIWDPPRTIFLFHGSYLRGFFLV
jgi:hypothetical protein